MDASVTRFPLYRFISCRPEDTQRYLNDKGIDFPVHSKGSNLFWGLDPCSDAVCEDVSSQDIIQQGLRELPRGVTHAADAVADSLLRVKDITTPPDDKFWAKGVRVQTHMFQEVQEGLKAAGQEDLARQVQDFYDGTRQKEMVSAQISNDWVWRLASTGAILTGLGGYEVGLSYLGAGEGTKHASHLGFWFLTMGEAALAGATARLFTDDVNVIRKTSAWSALTAGVGNALWNAARHDFDQNGLMFGGLSLVTGAGLFSVFHFVVEEQEVDLWNRDLVNEPSGALLLGRKVEDRRRYSLISVGGALLATGVGMIAVEAAGMGPKLSHMGQPFLSGGTPLLAGGVASFLTDDPILVDRVTGVSFIVAGLGNAVASWIRYGVILPTDSHSQRAGLLASYLPFDVSMNLVIASVGYLFLTTKESETGKSLAQDVTLLPQLTPDGAGLQLSLRW